MFKFPKSSITRNLSLDNGQWNIIDSGAADEANKILRDSCVRAVVGTLSCPSLSWGMLHRYLDPTEKKNAGKDEFVMIFQLDEGRNYDPVPLGAFNADDVSSIVIEDRDGATVGIRSDDINELREEEERLESGIDYFRRIIASIEASKGDVSDKIAQLLGRQ